MKIGIYDLGILGSDDAIYLYDEFFYEYDEGKSLSQIQEEITRDWFSQNELTPLIRELRLSAYVKALWEVNALADQNIEELIALISSNKSKMEWENLEKGLWSKRKKILKKFVEEIKIPVEKEVPRNLPPALEIKMYNIGDILGFQLENKFYCCVIIVDFEKERNQYSYTFNITDFYGENLPTLDSLLKENHIYTVKYLGIPGMPFPEKASGFAISLRQSIIKENHEKFNKIGQLEFVIQEYNSMFSGAKNWDKFVSHFPYSNTIRMEEKTGMYKYEKELIANFFECK